jgi:hypothetical protein
MLATLFFPAVIRDDFGKGSSMTYQVLLWMLIVMYVMLTFLNFYWFSRMAKGVIKALSKDKSKEVETDKKK